MTTVRNEPDAAAGLSTQPPNPNDRTYRRFRPVMRTWRWLTSMRTALVLLFLLALGIIPGSVLPQRSLNPDKVDTYFTQHPHLAPILDHLSMFDVFGAPWFAAIYLLLFISLIGCLVPRTRLHVRAMRTPPPAAPRNLARLPVSGDYTTDEDTRSAAQAAAATLRRARWRVRVRDEDSGAITVAAEKGYLRETGNLLFHISLTGLLVAVAVGKLWGYSGSVLVQDGDGFCNTVQQYDTFKPGEQISGSSLTPFCMTLKNFHASYNSDGTAKDFKAAITYNDTGSGPTKSDVLRSNHPLRTQGVRLYLLGHGYSPTFTIRDASGQVFKSISQPFLGQDANVTSQGALKLADAKPKQLAIDGLFLPTAADTGSGVLTSVWPQATAPAVAIFAYEGNLGLDSGQPQSVYSIDQQQLKTGVLKRVGQANLTPGRSLHLKDGTVITFTGYKQWASLQVSRDPAQIWALIAAGGILLGLLLSMRIRRRRVWLRLTPADAQDVSSRTVVQAGGLARSDTSALETEFRRITEKLRGPHGKDD